ncbi:hypothetical protein JQK87_04015 [Streptomyces sp. G44]|uniref:hypothetical protein n=1 Tax=Streptomyces sp. G44 TaxID=2807632 RepID=UPI0019620DE5|nr:hypothetical protein [Streptomyces sp. G44]MBM7167586.1 hypothetical protein [Streptomyces sp. G44]
MPMRRQMTCAVPSFSTGRTARWRVGLVVGVVVASIPLLASRLALAHALPSSRWRRRRWSP